MSKLDVSVVSRKEQAENVPMDDYNDRKEYDSVGRKKNTPPKTVKRDPRGRPSRKNNRR